MTEKLLEIQNLTKTYYEGTAECRVVDNVDLIVNRGEFVMIMGASGSGKTSLLHLIAGIDESDTGTITYTLPAPPPSSLTKAPVWRHTGNHTSDFSHMNEKTKAIFRRTNIGIVFQQQCLIPDLTVYENILLPMMLACHPPGRDRNLPSRRKEIIFNLCSQFGLKEHIGKYPSQLSGGQQQRAAILRSVVNKPPLLLCDEPTGSLNSAQTELVMDLLNELNRNGQTIVLVTHDRKVAVRGQKVVYIEDGHITGELRFPEAMSDDSSRELYDERESELTHFLQNRGW